MDEQLLIRFLTRTCTSEEIKAVDRWIASGKANADWLFEIERVWSLKNELRFSDQKEIEEAYGTFISTLAQGKNKNAFTRFYLQSMYSWIKYIAVLAIISLLVLNLFQINREEITYNEIEIPKGQYLSLTLSDGTKVWLNAQSKLKYPIRFSKKQRTVELEGEAFFEVAHNKEVPFIVESPLLNVKVLGTKFNLRSFKEKEAVISLAEGKVEVEGFDHTDRQILHPGQQLSFSKEKGMTFMPDMDINLIGTWTKGEIYFQKERLDKISYELERKFNVKIEISNEQLKAEIFTCHFNEKATIEEILSLLKETRRLNYKMQNGTILIFKSK